MDLDDDLDNHLCLRCQATIIGLDNYVQHKKKTCPSLVSKKDVIIETIKPKMVTNEELTKGLSSTSANYSKVHRQSQPDDFFLSLELQHNKTKHVSDKLLGMNERSQMKTLGKVIDDDDAASTVSSIHFESTLEDINQFNIDSTTIVQCDANDEFESDVENIEEYENVCPPREHTGGKWKPGMIQSKCLQWLTQPSLSTDIDRECERESNNCVPCDLHFKSTYLFLEHLLAPTHWSKSQYNPDNTALLLKHSAKLALMAPFSCAVCQFYFNSLQYLIEHWSINCKNHSNKEIVFVCSLCKTYCTSVNTVTAHLKNENHMGKISCKTPLVISAVKRNGPFACKLCSYEARSYSSFAAHMKCKHQCSPDSKVEKEKVIELEELSISDVQHVCSHCHLRLSSSSSLKDHIANVHSTDAFVCVLCPLTFKKRSHLLKHKKVHSNRNSHTSKEHVEGRFSCKKCSFKDDIEAEVLFHETFHLDPILKPVIDSNTSVGKQCKKGARCYLCPICEMLFRKSCMLEHLLAHTGEKPYKCEFCDASFSRKSSVYSHQKGMHGGKNLVCNQCSYKTHKKSKLKLHIQTHEVNRPRPFMCDICGLSFMQSFSLRVHMKVHLGYKTHICSFKGCEKSFRSASELVIHFRTHTNERPFLCTQCGYAAKTRHQLTKHERSHTGEKPFKCTFCAYAAALSSQLWRHMRIHTGSRPYSCPHCKYTCNTSENLRKHVLKSKKHKGLNVYVCPYCSFGCDHLKQFQDHVLEEHKDCVDTNEIHSPTYFSLLSGVYDRNLSKFNSKSSDVSKTIEYKPKNSGKSVTEHPLHDNSDEHLIVEHVLLEDMVLKVVVPKDSGNRNSNDLESKTRDSISIKRHEETDQCVSVLESSCDDGVGNTITLTMSSGIEESTTESLILSNVDDNLNGETIFVYVPV